MKRLWMRRGTRQVIHTYSDLLAVVMLQALRSCVWVGQGKRQMHLVWCWLHLCSCIPQVPGISSGDWNALKTRTPTQPHFNFFDRISLPCARAQLSVTPPRCIAAELAWSNWVNQIRSNNGVKWGLSPLSSTFTASTEPKPIHVLLLINIFFVGARVPQIIHSSQD